MWISHPSRHYLYYRLSRNTDQIGAILTDFREDGLAVPRDGKVFDDFVRKVIRFRRDNPVPAGFNPRTKPINRSTLDFLKKWKIHGMWLREDAVCRAEDILHAPSVRHPLEVMLLGPISPTEIATRLRVRHGLPEPVMNPAVVRAYAHYFWDYTALTIPQWAETILGWLPIVDKTDMLSALHAPRTQAGAALVMSVADGSIDHLPPAELYDTVKAFGYRMFMQHALLQAPSMSRTQAALAAFQIMQGAGEEADRHRGGNTDLMREFDRLEQTYDTAPQKTIHDLPIVREQFSLPETTIIDSTAEEQKP